MSCVAEMMAMKFANAEACEETGEQKQRPVSREAKEKSVLHWAHYPTHRRVCRLRSCRMRILILSGGRSHTFLVLIGKELARLVTRGSLARIRAFNSCRT
jgi:hypothetical protein